MTNTAEATLGARILHPCKEATELLGGISRSTLYVLIEKGELQTVKIGRRTFIPETSIREFVSKLGVR